MDAYDRCTNLGRKKILPIVLPSMVKAENFSDYPHIAVPIFRVSELTSYWEMIQFVWQFQYVLYTGHSTSFLVVVNVILISVLDLRFSLWRLVSPCESALAARQCSANIHNASYLVGMPYHTPLSTAVGSKFEMVTDVW